MAERLQKVIAQSGVASRRKAEKLITEGRVSVNGKIIAELGTKVESNQEVAVDDIPIQKEPIHTYLLYKPRGVISTTHDEKGRKTVLDFFEDKPYRLYPVGRLDYDTSGLLLITNDGALANKLMHPRHEIPKVYVAKIKGFLTPEAIHALVHGVMIDGKKSAPAKLKILKTNKDKGTSIVQLTIHEGHYHQVKKMFSAVGYLVDKLSREKYAFLTLQSLTSGKYRELSRQEVYKLNHLV